MHAQSNSFIVLNICLEVDDINPTNHFLVIAPQFTITMTSFRHLLLYVFLCLATGITSEAVAQTWLKIATGGYHTLALKSDGTVWTWGYNNYGQLGNGTTTSSNIPIQVSGLSNITDIGAGLSFSLAVGSNGTIYTWGRNNFGQLGNGNYNNSSTPVQVTGLSGTVSAIGGGQGHCLALMSNGTVYAWGYNISGQLGNGTYNDSPTPVQVSGLSNITRIAVGYNQNMALTNSGAIYVWGYNGYGQLGLGNYNDSPTPTTVSLGAGITATAIAGRGFHSVAIGSNGNIYTWGRNDYGQLGNGSATQTNTPTAITLAAGVTPVAIAASYYHSMALGNDGKLYSWGRNDFGQLGNGTTTESRTPTVSNTSNMGGQAITAMAIGIYHGVLLASGQNEIYTAGDNSNSQLGDGTSVARSTVYSISLACGQINALAGNNSSATFNAPAAGNTLILQSGCTSIASVRPGGASPVTGSITAKEYVSSSAPIYNGVPYVRRYYNITPATGANTATADVTLYFAQSDFDNYNANRDTLPSLPTSTADVQGYKTNLRISQQHGTSSSGAPGTYTGWSGTGPARVLIIPSTVTYNSAASRWEVTFPITGFSGFFAHTTATGVPLPVKLTSFTGRKEGYRNRLDWTTGIESEGTTFSIERSTDGRNFTAIGTRNGKDRAADYTFYDEQPLIGTSYYRLRVTESGGNSQYSNIATIFTNSTGGGAVAISPVPATRSFRITCSDVSLTGQVAIVYNMQGMEVYRMILSADQAIDISGWAAGIYSLKLPGGNMLRLVKQ